MGVIRTVLGDISTDELQLILPHEHLFVDLRGLDAPGYGQADTEEVMEVVMPSIRAMQKSGIDALAECSTVGVGRNITILKELANRSGFPIIAPTGIYRGVFIPAFAYQQSCSQLAEWMIGEITQGIDDSGVKAGFIKLAMSDQGITDAEEKILRAAAVAGRETGVALVSHTVSGEAALREIEILSQEKFPRGKFVWVHAHVAAEKEDYCVKEAFQRGAIVEFDAIGGGEKEPGEKDDFFIRIIEKYVKEEFTLQILLSQDAVGYTAGEPRGGKQRDFCYLLNKFIPLLRQRLDEEIIQQLIIENPRRILQISRNR